MERTLVVLTLLFGVCSATLAPLIIHNDTVPIKNQYIVVFKKSHTSTDVTEQEILKVSGLSGVTELHSYRRVIHGLSVEVQSETVLNSIRELSFVQFVEQDGKVNITAIGNWKAADGQSYTWGLDRIDQRNLPLDGQSSFNGDGSGVNAYIIDTGIYPQHEYFGGRAHVAFDAVDDGQQGIDCHGHGTHCAGTVGAEHYGIARGVNLFGVRVLTCDGWGYWSWVIAGLDWVAVNGIRPAVASMSLGGWAYESADQAVQGLYDAGVTVSVAAGNSNNDACYFSPARAPSAITVAASDDLDYRAYFSSYGQCVDIFAPGVNVLSTMIGNPKATATWSGTSMACPHVTGAAVLALGNDVTLTPKQVWEKMKDGGIFRRAPVLSLGNDTTLTPKDVWEKLKDDSTSGVVQNAGLLSPDRLLFIP